MINMNNIAQSRKERRENLGDPGVLARDFCGFCAFCGYHIRAHPCHPWLLPSSRFPSVPSCSSCYILCLLRLFVANHSRPLSIKTLALLASWREIFALSWPTLISFPLRSLLFKKIRVYPRNLWFNPLNPRHNVPLFTKISPTIS